MSLTIVRASGRHLYRSAMLIVGILGYAPPVIGSVHLNVEADARRVLVTDTFAGVMVEAAARGVFVTDTFAGVMVGIALCSSTDSGKVQPTRQNKATRLSKRIFGIDVPMIVHSTTLYSK